MRCWAGSTGGWRRAQLPDGGGGRGRPPLRLVPPPAPSAPRGVLGDAAGNFDWGKRFVIADDSTNSDTGYPCSVLRKDGRVLTFYYAVGSKTRLEWGVHCAVAEYRPKAK